MFTYKNGELYCEGVRTETIVRYAGTPVYVYSKNSIIENILSYKTGYKDIPNILCYAAKANTNLNVCKTVFSTGAGADIISGGELFKALKAGCNPQKIVFAGIGKAEDEIRYAIRSKILMFNAESLTELSVLNSVAGSMKARINVAIRVNPNVDAHTHKHITTGTSENKFGIPYSKALQAFKYAQACKNLNVCGIHCHIGSQITSVSPFAETAKKMSGLFKTLAGLGIHIRYLDIGGGLGIKYLHENPPKPVDVAKKIVPLFKPLGITLIVEPGRYIVGNAGILLTKVLYNKAGEHKNFVVLDTAMNDLIRPALYGAYHAVSPVVLHKNRKLVLADLVGPICESGDFVAKKRLLPARLSGEHLAIMCAGAYGFSMSSQYNSRPRAAEVMVDGKKWSIIRKRETYADLIDKER